VLPPDFYKNRAMDLYLSGSLSNLPLHFKSNFMKKRLSRVLNFFAFNLLFFALYLNFIHKDSNTPAPIPNKSGAATVQGTTLVSNPEQYLNKTKEGVHGNDQRLSYN
jgi:hypothetical protein